jgi:hypothetical protein
LEFFLVILLYSLGLILLLKAGKRRGGGSVEARITRRDKRKQRKAKENDERKPNELR